MPSLHFATSVMAAHVLTDTGPVAGAVGWSYALTLGFALVYLGEPYLVDLLAGVTLTQGGRRLGPRDEEQLPRDEEDGGDDEMPRVHLTRERILLLVLFVVSAIAFLYFVLPRLAGLGKTWDRIQEGDPWWLAAAFVLECLSFGGYIVLFRALCTAARPRG